MAKQIVYFEHYPHYMGTKNATLKLTLKEFDTLITMSKAAIKADKNGEDCDAEEALDNYIDKIAEKQKQIVYALDNALINYYASPRRPSSIANAIKKKGVWSGEWEEGSHAFATTKKKAVKAVGKIEAKHAEDELDW